MIANNLSTVHAETNDEVVAAGRGYMLRRVSRVPKKNTCSTILFWDRQSRHGQRHGTRFVRPALLDNGDLSMAVVATFITSNNPIYL